jgi:hypothetical protein
MQPVGEKGDVEDNYDDEDDDKDEDEDASAPEEVQAKGQQTGVAAGKAGAPAVIGPENRKSPPVNSGGSVVVETKTKKPAGAKEGDPAVAERKTRSMEKCRTEMLVLMWLRMWHLAGLLGSCGTRSTRLLGEHIKDKKTDLRFNFCSNGELCEGVAPEYSNWTLAAPTCCAHISNY